MLANRNDNQAVFKYQATSKGRALSRRAQKIEKTHAVRTTSSGQLAGPLMSRSAQKYGQRPMYEVVDGQKYNVTSSSRQLRSNGA